MRKAVAQANGFGFPKTQARPKAVSGQRYGPAWPGFFWLGLARLLASSRSRHITSRDVSRLCNGGTDTTWSTKLFDEEGVV
jgi:hypothetical protein